MNRRALDPWKVLLLWAVLTGLALASPPDLAGQGIRMPELAPSTSLASRCRAGDPDRSGPAWLRVREALANPGDERWGPMLAELQDSLEASLAQGADVETRYLLAAVLGARSEVSSGRSKLEWAGAMQREAVAILAEDPSHAGAHHLMGRLHAAVQRLGGLKRFLARRLFGGEVLNGASWDSARRHLEYAKLQAPCAPEHHYELARLHADLGETAEARREGGHVLELIGDRPERLAMASKVAALLDELPEDARADEGAERTSEEIAYGDLDL